MPGSKRFSHPEAIARISRLQLRAKGIIEGLSSGMHRSPYFGHSVEFRQHRQYALGDDPRHVDWKVWAKQDKYYVKQFEEETNVRCVFLVDCSESMSYGEGERSKFEYAGTLACSLAYLTLKQHDAAACFPFDSKLRKGTPLRSSLSHLGEIAKILNHQPLAEKTDLEHVMSALARDLHRRSMVIVVSDLFAPREGLAKGLKLLRQRGHEIVVMHVLEGDELDFPFSGPTRFEGLETADNMNCDPRALRDGYMQAMERFMEEVRRCCSRNHAEYVLARTDRPLDALLAEFLSNRMVKRT